MAQSYSNPGGQGDRVALINLLGTLSISVAPYRLLDGANTNTSFFGSGQSSKTLVFDFGDPRIVDECTWRQSANTGQGTWKWQGSNDNSTYTDIGSTFTLGGATVQTQTQLNGNTTAYRYYRLFQTAGTTSSTPYIQGVEFRIDDNSANLISWTNSNSSGARTGSITTSTTATLAGGTISKLVDGAIANGYSFSLSFNSGQSGRSVTFQFSTPLILKEAKWFQSGSGSQGTWKWQGSPDGSTWTDIGGTFTLDVGSTVYGSNRAYHTTLNANTTAYPYYRLLQTAGTTNSSPYLQEILFQIGPAPASSDEGGIVILW